MTFPAPIGIASGLCHDGTGVDGMFAASGMNKNGLSTFIECGSCAPERQHSKRLFEPVIKINLSNKKVEEVNQRIAPGVTEVIANLLQRQ